MSDQEFRFEHPVDVRFRDIDIGGHVHHSEALVYFEEARAAYWREVVGRRGVDDVDYILAEAEIRYHARVLYPDRLSVGVRMSRMGKKHFELQYRVRSSRAERVLSGRTVQVMYDYERGASQRIPDDVQARMEAFEKGPKPSSSGDTAT